MDAFAAHVLHQDGFVEIALIGELDVAATEVLRETVLALPARYDADQVVFNCVALDFIDFYGVRSLLELGSRFGGTGRLTLRYPRQQAKRVLELAGASEAFRIDEELTS